MTKKSRSRSFSKSPFLRRFSRSPNFKDSLGSVVPFIADQISKTSSNSNTKKSTNSSTKKRWGIKKMVRFLTTRKRGARVYGKN